MKNLLLLKGGGSQEHDVSLITADYLQSIINKDEFKVFDVLVEEGFKWKLNGKAVKLNFEKELVQEDGRPIAKMDVCVPAFHGYPGETGHIQAYFEMIGLPFIGCGYEASAICFNKVLTKLWLEKAGVPVAEFEIAGDASPATIKKLEDFYDRHGKLFIKASNQGSSVGCYPVTKKEDIAPSIEKALGFSDFAIVERMLDPRELEISVYESQGQLVATRPCEILCPDKFYSFEEKYSKESKTQTDLDPQIDDQVIEEIKRHARAAFATLKLSQFVRMDFFLENGQVYLNEINTFPGMTPISMFPKMIEKGGLKYQDLLHEHLNALV